MIWDMELVDQGHKVTYKQLSNTVRQLISYDKVLKKNTISLLDITIKTYLILSPSQYRFQINEINLVIINFMFKLRSSIYVYQLVIGKFSRKI